METSREILSKTPGIQMAVAGPSLGSEAEQQTSPDRWPAAAGPPPQLRLPRWNHQDSGLHNYPSASGSRYDQRPTGLTAFSAAARRLSATCSPTVAPDPWRAGRSGPFRPMFHN